MSYNLLKLLTVSKVILRMLLRVSINLKEERGGRGEKEKSRGGGEPKHLTNSLSPGTTFSFEIQSLS